VEKHKLYLQFWSECFLVCAIAFFLSLVLVNVLIHAVNSLMHINIPLTSLMWQPTFLLIGLALLLLVSILAGAYPSWVMARFRVVESLKGKISLKRKSPLRSSLIVTQFIIACIMINCTYVIYKQFKYMQLADLGIEKEYIISIPFDKPEKGHEMIEKLRTRLSGQSGILSLTGSSVNIGLGKDHSTSKWTTGFDYKGKTISSNMVSADYDYLKTLGLKITEGRDFDRNFGRDTNYDVLVSQSLANQFGEKQLIGQQIIVDSAQPRWNIIGVFPDFHLYSLHEKIQPLAIMMNQHAALDYCFIKTKSEKSLAIMDLVKNEMAGLEPGIEFKGGFLNENVNNWYQQEQMLSVLFAIAATIAILLSCMGLLAMVLLMIKQRVKEIGVRKVLGASVPSLSIFIAKDFLLLVLIAILIAMPISWIFMNKWLLDFPYKITLQWWMFGIVGLLALAIALLTVAANTINAARQNPVKSLRTE
jgi:putative ABC transport system permease protein